MQSNCNDIRITDHNGQLLPHWIELNPSANTCNQSTTKIWVKVPTIPADNGYIYVYYGNPSANNNQNPTNTFIYFENFESYSDVTDLANAGWTDISINSGQMKFTTDNGVDSSKALWLDPDNGSGWDKTEAYLTSPTFSVGSTFDLDYYATSDNAHSSPIGFSDSTSLTGGCNNDAANQVVITGNCDVPDQYNDQFITEASDTATKTSADFTRSSWNKLSIKWNSTTSSISVNDSELATSSTNIPSGSLYLHLAQFPEGTSYLEGYFDNLRVRKNTANEPTVSLASEETTPGPVAYWKFDEGADNTCSGGTNDVCDATQNGNDGAINGATWQSEDQCISGKCLDFDRDQSDYVTISSPPTLGNISNKITITAWVQWRGDGTGGETQQMIIRGGSGPFRFGINDPTGNGNLAFYCAGCTSQQWHVSNTAVPKNKWQHVAVTIDGSTIKLYQDGIETASASNDGTFGSSGTWFIGTLSSTTYNWNGLIDEVKIYPYARSAAEIKQDYINGAASAGSSAVLGIADTSFLNDGLVGYWPMDEASGTSVADKSGNGNTGTLTNAQETGTSDASGNTTTTLIDTDGTLSSTDDAYNNMILKITDDATCPLSADEERIISDYTGSTQTFTVSPAFSAAPDTCTYTVLHQVGGKFGNSVQFDDENSYIAAGNSNVADMTTNSFSINAWAKFKASQSTTHEYLLSKGTTVDGYLLRFSDVGSNVYKPVFLYADGSQNAITGVTQVNDDSWHMITTVYNTETSQTQIYVDGNLEASGDTISGSMTNSHILKIGAYYDGTANPNGTIDDVRIYNRALSPGEVAALYSWAPGPVGYWSMDEGVSGDAQTIYDRSGNGNNGTTVDGANNTGMNCNIPGKFGKACEFDGVDDYINAGNDTSLQINNHITISAWVKSSYSGSDQAIVHKYHSGGGAYALYINGVGNLGFLSYDGSNVVNELTHSQNVADGIWHYVAITVNNTTGIVYWYIDGILVETDTFTPIGTWLNSQNVYIGYRAKVGTESWFNGKIDEVKIYNYARTQEQILQDMKGTSASVLGSSTAGGIPHPIAHWSFDEGYGQTANDSVGSNDGTLGADSGSSTDDPTWITSDSGNCKNNGCLSFDGGDYLNITNDSSIQITTGTLTAWVKTPDSGSDYRGVLVKQSAYGMFLGGISCTDNELTTYDWGGANNRCSSSGSLADNQWHHIVFTFQSGISNGSHFYVDGKYISSTTITVSNQTKGLSIGTGDYPFNAQYFNGLIDEVKIYNFALTPEQVKYDYNAGAGVVLGRDQEASDIADGAGDPPVAEWKFDEKTGTSAYDTSGNNFTQTFYGSPSWQPSSSCRFGACLKFGTSNYTKTADSDILDIDTGSMTWELWFKTTETNRGIMLRKSDSSNTNGVLIDIGNNTSGLLRCNVHYSPAILVSSNNTNYNDGNWHHLACILDRGSTLKMYIDGKLDNSSDASSLPASSLNANSGLYLGYYSTEFDGLIDHVKIYDYARTPAQVAYDYNRGKPVAHWKFDECQGTAAYDSSGNGNHGTINIGTSGTNTTPGTCSTSGAWADGASGKFNASLDIDSTDDKIVVADSSVLEFDDNISFSVWTTANTGWSTPIHGNNDGLSWGSSYILLIHDNTISCMFNGTSNPRSDYTSADLGTTSQWKHIVCTYDGSTARVYLNGKLVHSWNTTGNITNDSGLTMGRTASDIYPLAQKLDDVRIYNYALSANQVKKLYNNASSIYFGP